MDPVVTDLPPALNAPLPPSRAPRSGLGRLWWANALIAVVTVAVWNAEYQAMERSAVRTGLVRTIEAGPRASRLVHVGLRESDSQAECVARWPPFLAAPSVHERIAVRVTPDDPRVCQPDAVWGLYAWTLTFGTLLLIVFAATLVLTVQCWRLGAVPAPSTPAPPLVPPLPPSRRSAPPRLPPSQEPRVRAEGRRSSSPLVPPP